MGPEDSPRDGREVSLLYLEWIDELRCAARIEVAADRYLRRDTEVKYRHIEFDVPHAIREAEPEVQRAWLDKELEKGLMEGEDEEYMRLWYQQGIEEFAIFPLDVEEFARRYNEEDH